jgi:hypothetical protein
MGQHLHDSSLVCRRELAWSVHSDVFELQEVQLVEPI